MNVVFSTIGVAMKLRSFLLGLSMVCFFASANAYQISPDQKKLYQIRLSMPFGDQKSDWEVYLFTDWNNDHTKEIEAKIEGVSSDISKKAKLYFIDLNSDKSTALTEVHLSYLINTQKNFTDYFKLRNTLLRGDSGTEKAKLPDDVIKSGIHIFNATAKNMKISEVPTILFYNLKTREQVKLEGVDAILKNDLVSYLK